ncbi:lycopene cyclase family protein [Halomonas vilamensis]|uniref:Lycopene cyclase family protein n=1 Tax=Vreelandella vilamensis TaxID=531309 RepID=A0ABU1H2F1_9GAMM|nr:lycopene cyclase family protein [Halomonas vilamensis]MDR5897852.1 lycopene cyclase family protein [Halomonas vilamensis]
MTLPADTDVAILGAGLAGLSIASWLVDMTPDHAPLPRLHLLEARQEDTHDRTWCFWDQQPHPFREAISHRWPRWQVSHQGQRVEHCDPDNAYAMLTANAMRRSAYARFALREELQLTRGVEVSAIMPQDESLRVTTSHGNLNARLVIDTRPPPLTALSQSLGVWQVFHGVEIYRPGHGYALSSACLMDFQTGQDGINFVYLLPLDEQRLLVEWTCFHPDRHSEQCQTLLAPELPWMLADWLNQQLGKHWSVQRSETGCLPMMPVTPPTLNARYLSAGIRGGWMRAATGYMFASCQQGAAEVARQLQQARANGHWQLTPPRLRSPALNWMDTVFLHAIRQHPEAAPGWFLALFSATSAGQQRRFLGDQPRWSDLLAIMKALPPGPFMRAAWPRWSMASRAR